MRYPRELRDSIEKLRTLPVVTETGAQVPLGAVAAIGIADGPPMLRSENARLAGWIYVDIRGRDLASVVHDAQARGRGRREAPPGVSVQWSGQFEYLERADEAARRRRPVHGGDHLRAALPGVPPLRRGGG